MLPLALSGVPSLLHSFTAICPPKDKTDKSEQEGMMHLYEGAVMALRNPRAHRLIDDDPEDAAHLIALINTLAKFIDKAKKV